MRIKMFIHICLIEVNTRFIAIIYHNEKVKGKSCVHWFCNKNKHWSAIMLYIQYNYCPVLIDLF